MAAPAIGRRPRWAPPTTAKVDRSHPLAYRLHNFLAGDMAIDFATGKTTTRNGSPTVAPTPYGLGLVCSSSAGVETRDFNSATYGGLGASIGCIVQITAAGGTYTSLLERNIAGDSQRDILVDINPSNGNSTYPQFNFLGSSSAPAASAWGLTVGPWFHAVMTWDGGTTNSLRYYNNGVQVATGSLNSATVSQIAANLFVGAAPSSASCDGIYAAAFVWSRCLSDAEVASSYADPFQMLRW